MDRLTWLLNQMDRVTHTRQCGWIGEQIVMELIPKERYILWQPRHRLDGDLHVIDRATGEFIRLEIKTSRVNQDGKFEYRLRKHDKHGVTDIGHADLVLLIGILRSGLIVFYLIPVADLGIQKSLCLPAKVDYHGKYAPYRLSSLQRFALPSGGGAQGRVLQ